MLLCSLLVPEPVYEKFSRQKKAIDFAHNSYQVSIIETLKLIVPSHIHHDYVSAECCHICVWIRGVWLRWSEKIHSHDLLRVWKEILVRKLYMHVIFKEWKKIYLCRKMAAVDRHHYEVIVEGRHASCSYLCKAKIINAHEQRFILCRWGVCLTLRFCWCFPWILFHSP